RHGLFGRSNLLKTATEMNRDCAHAVRCTPRHRLRKSIVNLEDARSWFKALHQAAEAFGEAITCYLNKLARRSIKQHCNLGRVQFVKHFGIDATRGVDFAAKALQLSAERLGDALRPCLRNGPDNLMGGRAQHQCNGGTEDVIETEKRMRSQPGEKSTCPRLRKTMHRNAPG